MLKQSIKNLPRDGVKPLIIWFRKRLSYEGLIRLIADAILINLAILFSLAARLLYIVAYGNPEANLDYRETFWQYMQAYGDSAWLLTIILLVIFNLSGFYTYGRFYRGRYKALIVVQAVSLGYLILVCWFISRRDHYSDSLKSLPTFRVSS